MWTERRELSRAGLKTALPLFKHALSAWQCDWQCFYDGCDDMNDLCDAVSSYINFCVDSIIPSKTVVMYPNNELKAVINKKKNIFYTGDPLEKKAVSREVRNEIRKAKIQYRDKIEEQYCSGDLRAAWQGIQQMASINQYSGETRQLTTISGVNDVDLPNAFNSFFSHFEKFDFFMQDLYIEDIFKTRKWNCHHRKESCFSVQKCEYQEGSWS